MLNDDISKAFFIFLKFSFFGLLRGGGEGVKGQKIAQNEKIITFVTHHISGTGKNVIMIFGALPLNDDISKHFFHFFEIFKFLGC